jgi:hypothetical protein
MASHLNAFEYSNAFEKSIWKHIKYKNLLDCNPKIKGIQHQLYDVVKTLSMNKTNTDNIIIPRWR